MRVNPSFPPILRPLRACIECGEMMTELALSRAKWQALKPVNPRPTKRVHLGEPGSLTKLQTQAGTAFRVR